MPVLHMETDLVRGVGTQLQQVASSLQQQTQQLNYSAQALSNAWQGPSADIFVSEIQPLLQYLNRIALEGDTLNQRLQREVDEWEQVSSKFGINNVMYVNKTTPTDASVSHVGDERSPWKQWLGDNTPLAFVPGFTPPAGGDIETIDDRLHMKFGRDVNLVDGNQVWTDHEVAAVDRAIEKFPDTLARSSLINNIYRASDKDPSGPPLGFWLPPNYNGDDYGAYEPSSITLFRGMPLNNTRQGGIGEVDRIETVMFHELVHSAQYNADGSMNDLTVSYLREFDWSDDAKTYYGDPNNFPGSSDTFLGQPVGYPESGRTGWEDMAEAITYYRYEPETLRRESPERYAWVKDHIFAGQEF